MCTLGMVACLEVVADLELEMMEIVIIHERDEDAGTSKSLQCASSNL